MITLNRRERSLTQNTMCEWTWEASQDHHDPFNTVRLDVLFSSATLTWKVPGFWDGGRMWKARFAPPTPGKYTFETICSDSQDSGLHGRQGAFHVKAYRGKNPLLKHGPLRVHSAGRYLEHRDATPFLWLGDTWWLGTSGRIAWPGEFKGLVRNRKQKGFSVVQMVVGLFPDMAAFDPRGANPGGQVWEEGFTQINPEFFRTVDAKVACLVNAGIVPCLLGCWGYYLTWMGQDRMRRHYRYLIARYGAYPIIWCLAGEARMPYYLSETPVEDAKAQATGWTEIARYVREVDPYHHPITIHPIDCGRNQLDDESVIDFEMLQTGHDGYNSVPNTWKLISEAVRRQPQMPVVEAEVNYEGMMGGSWEDVQRFMFWSAILSGARGFTYGANGIWQFNRPGDPFGRSPFGYAWGNRSWQEMQDARGSQHVGNSKRFLDAYPWWEFEAHQEWVAPCATGENPRAAYAAGVPGKLRFIYLPKSPVPWYRVTVREIEMDIQYQAKCFDAATGETHELGSAIPDANGTWPVPLLPSLEDWVLVLECRDPNVALESATPSELGRS